MTNRAAFKLYMAEYRRWYQWWGRFEGESLKQLNEGVKMDSDYRDAQATVLTAMGWVDPFADSRVIEHGWVWDRPDGRRIEASTLDANWCFGVFVPWCEAHGMVPTIEIRDGLADCVWSDYATGTQRGGTVKAPTIEEAMIRAAAQAVAP